MKARSSIGAVALGALLLITILSGSFGPEIASAQAIENGAPATSSRFAFGSSDIFVHLPPQVSPNETLRVLLVLHGMGGQGAAFAQPLIDAADRNHWVLVAPTMPYAADYLDPAPLMQEDLQVVKYLQTLLDELPARLGLRLHHRALILGFSRGAQVAHRFAFFYPEHVESVAAISAGSYTMPLLMSDHKVLNFPFGVGDLRQRVGAPVDWYAFDSISFWIAVGNRDDRTADVARAFDPYCGHTRVERAKAFESALLDMGVDAHLALFANADHEMTSEIKDGALQFLRQDELSDNLED
jgi:pimeloyl-ACP methyl ester carboxylesterase